MSMDRPDDGPERTGVVRNVPETTGTKVESPAAEAYPLEDDGVEATGGVRGGHSHSTNPGQSSVPLDRGVDPGHLRSPSQGVRPEGIDDAVDPSLGPDDRPGR